MDVTTGANDPTIGARAYSDDPALVGDLGSAAATGMLASGVLPSIKHFPGHGSVPADSHLELPVQTASLAELETRDWAPFKAAADSGVPVMMMGHIAVDALDPDRVVVTFGSYINRHSNDDNGCEPAGFSEDTGNPLYTGVKTVGACNNDIVFSVSDDGGASFTGTDTDVRELPSATSAAPMVRMQWWMRPGPSLPCAISKPRPSPSRRLEAGTRTLSNDIWAWPCGASS